MVRILHLCVFAVLHTVTCTSEPHAIAANSTSYSLEDSAFHFAEKGVNDVINITGMPTLTEFTACFWMNSSDRKGTPLSYAVPQEKNELVIDYNNYFMLSIGGEGSDISVSAHDGRWHHICVSWERNSGSWKFYKDGDLKKQGTNLRKGHTIRQGGILMLGQEQDSVGGGFDPDQSFQGMLTNVNIWNQSLTAEQIEQMSKLCLLDEATEHKVYEWLDFVNKGGVRLVKPSPCGPIEEIWSAWSPCSRTCGEGTQARTRSCKYQKCTEMRVCHPIKPCSVPRRSIQVRVTSSKSLFVNWTSEWQDRWPQELRQFLITYNTLANETAKNVTVDALHKSVELRGLLAFTWYCVRVLLVTHEGVGEQSPCVFGKTQQDVPCSSPTGLAAVSRFSPFRIHVTWAALPDSCWQGVQSGYSIRLQMKETVHEENTKWTGEFVVLPFSTEALLNGLQTYTTYSLQVAAFTEIGPGPYSKEIYVETCRCPNRVFVHWKQVPQLCVSPDTSNEKVPGGLLPELVQDMIRHVCGTCRQHTRTEIIFKEANSSSQNITGSLNHHIQLNLPVRIASQEPTKGEGLGLLPVVEVPGFAFVIRKPSTDAYAVFIASCVLSCWPAFVMMLVMYFTFGLAAWTVEKYANPTHFPPRFTRGWREGVWWSFVSMTTVGYGDRYPTSVPGRLLTIVCFLVGVVITALFVSALTSLLTVFTLNILANPEQGKSIGVINGSLEHRYALRVNGTKGTHYYSSNTLVHGIKSRALDGALTDVISADSLIRDLDDPDFEVYKIVPNRFYYGIELIGEARHFLRDFEEYLKTISIENRLEKKNVDQGTNHHSTQAMPTMAQQMEAIEFSDPRNFLYQGTVKVTGLALVVFATSGLVYHLTQIWLKRKAKDVKNKATCELKAQLSDSQPKPAAIRAEMRQLLEEFHTRIQQTYFALKLKHRRELLQIRQKRTRAARAVQIRCKKYTLEQPV